MLDVLHTAVARASRPAYAIVDGTLIPIDRVADERPYYSGKHKRHGMNVQVLADPAGRLVWLKAVCGVAAVAVSSTNTHMPLELRGWGFGRRMTTTATTRYGTATATAWDRLHPKLTRRAAWITHDMELPLIEGTVIRLTVEHLPGGGEPKPVWLWWSGTGADAADVDRLWQAFLRRFDLEHTFRLFKQTLGWTAPKIRDPEAADRWAWLILARTRSCAWPGRWPPICAARGRNPHRPTG